MGNLHSQNILVSQKVASHIGSIDDLITNLGDADNEPYYINAELFQMISSCPATSTVKVTRTLLTAPTAPLRHKLLLEIEVIIINE